LVKDNYSIIEESDFTTLNYLIKDFDISYHYSAALWLEGFENKSSQRSSDDNFIGFAPVFRSNSDSGYISMNNNLGVDSNLVQLTIRSVSIDGKRYKELSHSEAEINDIIQLFTKRSKEARGYLHAQATESNFKENISNYKFVHVATHGFSNDNRSELSGLLFAVPDNISNSNTRPLNDNSSKSYDEKYSDGILYAGEMYNLDLNADLVVLSACETGIGRLVKGEGVMAITRGFLYSGVPNILFSLWKVGDKNTYQLMVNFYDELLNGNSYSGSIRKSKLNLIQKKETAFPKFWSSFVLLGK
jgi:CHAT domain-containing protein